MSGLLEKYSGLRGDATAETQHHEVITFIPEWMGYPATRAIAGDLQRLDIKASALETKTLLMGKAAVLKATFEVLSGCTEEKATQWILTLFYDMLRADSSCTVVFEEAIKSKIDVYGKLMSVLKSDMGSYTKDKAAWVLTCIISTVPQSFSESNVSDVTSIVCSRYSQCSPLGALEAICNLLKAVSFRAFVWSQVGVQKCIFDVEPKTAQPALAYKCVLAIWLLSYESGKTLEEVRKCKAVEKVRDILAICRAEKVVRMSLTVLKNLMPHKAFCEDMVESNMLEVVQAVEYEKWRDAELYDDIKELCGMISSEVSELSNFDRYERELKSGSLKWGYTHTSKFWGENVMKFESNDFRALKTLAALLLKPTSDNQTLAVACYDLGEFVSLHPLGKRKVAQLQVKERVMELMGSPGDNMREVRREALLCCQKIMLNKWQDLEKAK